MADRYTVYDRSGSKIGEVSRRTDWTGAGGNLAGLFILGALFGLLLFFRRWPGLTLALVVSAGIFLVCSGVSNQATVNQTRAAAAAVEAEIQAKPNYFTETARKASLVIEPVHGFTHENVRGSDKNGVYFDLTVRNEDTKDHSGLTVISFTVDVTRFVPQDPYSRRSVELKEHVSVPASSTVTKKVVFDTRFAFSRDVENFEARFLTIDGKPAVDPRDALSELSMSAQLADPPFLAGAGGGWMQCQITFTNSGALPHTIKTGASWEYTYRQLGELKKHSGGSVEERTLNLTASTTVPAGGSVVYDQDPSSLKTSPLRIPVSGYPEQGLELRLTGITVLLLDPGLDNAPANTRKRTFDATGCNYP